LGYGADNEINFMFSAAASLFLPVPAIHIYKESVNYIKDNF